MAGSTTHFIKDYTIIFVSMILMFSLNKNVVASKPSDELPINRHSLIILQYHHVSSNTPSSTSVTPETFLRHMTLLANNYHVIDLATALAKLKNNLKLPNKSVAITFDDGYINILENAHPILSKFKFPYTIFVNPAIIDNFSSQLSWSEMQGMRPLATFANHSYDHKHLLAKDKSESHDLWLKRVMGDINQAEKILYEKVGYSKKWLAYPFGEYNSALKKELLSQGYIGFGQQSGGASINSDFGALPRFPAAGVYANLDSLEIKLNSFAMPVKSVKPIDNEFQLGETIDQLVLEIDDRDVNIAKLGCYFNSIALEQKRIEGKVFVTVNHKLVAGRARINCTAPSNTFPERFYWYSFPMFTATANGEFID